MILMEYQIKSAPIVPMCFKGSLIVPVPRTTECKIAFITIIAPRLVPKLKDLKLNLFLYLGSELPASLTADGEARGLAQYPLSATSRL